MTHKITVATIISLVFTSFFLPRVVVGQRVAPRAVEDEHFATWRPAESDAVALDMEFARGLLARGLAELASSELARLESRVATESAEVRARFGALAATAALDSSLLDSSSARASVASRLGELRALVEGSDSTGYDYFSKLTEVDSAGLAYALAISRAYAYLGASGAPEFLDVALKITELLARSLPASPCAPERVLCLAEEPVEQTGQRGQTTDRSPASGLGRERQGLRLSQAARRPSRSGRDVLPEPGCASDPSRRDRGADRLQTLSRHL